MLTEHPSAAPTPVSLNTCWACTKFSADSKALVMKWRAEKSEKAQNLLYRQSKAASKVLRVFPLYSLLALKVLME